MLLVIDNYDSFVYNLARHFQRLGQPTRVVRNDAIDVAGVRRLAPAALVLSPGPCAPEQAGCSLALVRELHGELPLLGVCLGHQAIACALGGRVVRAPQPLHGQATPVYHEHAGVFQGLPNPLDGGRYHSLVVDEATLPAELLVTARTAEGVIMALEHRTLPVVGLQFHPESILTPAGYHLLAAFLDRAGLARPAELPPFSSELAAPPAAPAPRGPTPVTF